MPRQAGESVVSVVESFVRSDATTEDTALVKISAASTLRSMLLIADSVTSLTQASWVSGTEIRTMGLVSTGFAALRAIA